ncbi:hypothetical protein D3C87_1393500 [compost metagenome]
MASENSRKGLATNPGKLTINENSIRKQIEAAKITYMADFSIADCAAAFFLTIAFIFR